MSRLDHSTEQEEIMAYLDGELPAGEAAQAAAHLKECRPCQQFAAELRTISQNMMDWEVAPFERELDGRVLTALQERESVEEDRADRRRSVWRNAWDIPRWRRWNWATAAAGIAILLVGGELLRVRYAAPETLSKPLIVAEQNQDRMAISSRAPAQTPTQEEVRRRQEAQFASSLAIDKGDAAGVVGGVPGYVPSAPGASPANQTMIAHTADLTITTQNFQAGRARVEEILRQQGGYVGEMNISSPADAEPKLTAVLRVPADRLLVTIAELKKLGHVQSESQAGEEVISQYVDLQARLTNARNTEQRLTELLRTRTGKLEEVVAVEEKLSQVREEIERMEAENKALTKRVDFATLNLSLSEEHRAQMQMVPRSVGTQFRNAAVEGYRSVVDSIVSLLLFLMSWGPTLLLWGAILFFPARYVWRKVRAHTAQ
jgi:hypothetical protein